MTATIIANNPALCKHMYLDKVNMDAKAHAAVKADEQATVHSKMVTAAAAASTEMNFLSSHKKGQKTASQAAQTYGGGHSGSHAERGSGYGRGGPRGNNARGRGGYTLSYHDREQSPDMSNRDRGSSDNRGH
jgi:hypothetical protein